jgi:diaminopimelate epimerase
MKVSVVKIQANGAGYLLVDGTRTALPNDLTSLVRQACDLRGLIGGEGLSYVNKIFPGGIALEAFSPDGSRQEFSANAALAAAAYHQSLYGEETVRVIQRGLTSVIHFQNESEVIKKCTFQSIDVLMLQDGVADLKPFLGRPTVDKSLQSIGIYKVGRRQLIYDAEIINDRALRRLGRLVNNHVGRLNSDVAVSIIRRVDGNRLFLRTFSRGGSGLVTSCTTSVAAAAVAAASLSGGIENPLSFTVFGIAGAAHVVVKDAIDDRVGVRVDVTTRAAVIYQAEADWDGQHFVGQLKGRLFFDTLSALTDLETSELATIAVSDFYVPEKKG